MTISNPGRPKMMAKIRGIAVFVCPGMTELRMRNVVKVIVTGRTTVPASSIPTTNCIKKQNVSRTRTGNYVAEAKVGSAPSSGNSSADLKGKRGRWD
jgi:hypothetical protein